jgi:hypothetical protein
MLSAALAARKRTTVGTAFGSAIDPVAAKLLADIVGLLTASAGLNPTRASLIEATKFGFGCATWVGIGQLCPPTSTKAARLTRLNEITSTRPIQRGSLDEMRGVRRALIDLPIPGQRKHERDYQIIGSSRGRFERGASCLRWRVNCR